MMLARVNGTELFFDIDGAGLVPDGNTMRQKPVLFMLHGGPGGDHVSLKTSMGQLTDLAQLVYVDHRGSGRSPAADPSTYTLDQNIDDIDALRAHLGLEQISVLGLSYGGMVAQGYAIRYPDRVTSLVLVATAPSFRFMDDAKRILQERGTADQRRVCEWLWDGSFTSLEQLREYYRVTGPLYSTRFDAAAFEDGWGRGIRNFEQLNFGFTTFLRSFDYTDQLHRIPCPTLVLGGTHDWICAPRHSRIIASRIPRAHLKIFRHSAHAIAVDQPDEFYTAIRGFLTEAAPIMDAASGAAPCDQ